MEVEIALNINGAINGNGFQPAYTLECYIPYKIDFQRIVTDQDSVVEITKDLINQLWRSEHWTTIGHFKVTTNTDDGYDQIVTQGIQSFLNEINLQGQKYFHAQTIGIISDSLTKSATKMQ